MGYYDLNSLQRKDLFHQMESTIILDVMSGTMQNIRKYASDPDTYIRKNSYLILGRLYKVDKKNRKNILSILDNLSKSDDEKVRQTVVYALGEIGKQDFDVVDHRLEAFLHEQHHSVKNGLTGAIKQIGERNPGPVFTWVKKQIQVCETDMSKRLLHGLELRGRTHPQELLPILTTVAQKSMDKEMRQMVVHIVGQISYKKGCIEKVLAELKIWHDQALVVDCKKEIVKVHKSYKKFSVLSVEEVEKYLEENLG